MDVPHEFPNVEVCGNILLVGEAHFHAESERLVERVLNVTSPDAVGIESPPTGLLFNKEGGMGRAKEYARGDCPLVGIDQSRLWFEENLPAGAPLRSVQRTANAPQAAVNSDGRMPLSAIQTARNNVRDEYGQTAFDTVYIEREWRMADRLRLIENQINGIVLAVIGAFHVPAVSTFLGLPSREISSLEDKRFYQSEFATSNEVAQTPATAD